MRTATGDRERVNLYMDVQVASSLKSLARLMNMTFSELVRQSCLEFLRTKGPGAVEAAKTAKELR